MLLVLIGALTLGVYSLVSLSDVLLETMRQSAHYLTRMSRLSTGDTLGVFGQSQTLSGGALDPGIVAQLRAHPDVATVLPENGLYVGVPMGGIVFFPVLGVTEADLPMVMDTCDLRLKTGRSISPGMGEIVLSEELARALGLEIGDRISYKIDADYYPTVATELTLVGILESVPADASPEVRAGFMPYEYLEAHELYQPRATNWLIIPRPGSRMTVNDFAENLITESTGSPSGHMQTFETELEALEQMQQFKDTTLGFMDGVVAVAAALVVGMIHRIAITHRLPELGLLHATGYPRQRLIRRLALEIAVVACAGWATGLICAHAFAILLDSTFFAAQGWSTNLTNPAPFLYTLPIPLVVVGWVNVSVSRTLNRLDPVAIVERGKLSMRRKRPTKAVKQTAPRPLSSLTFLARHRSRSILLLAAIGLMVVSVALPGFLIAMLYDSMLPLSLSYSSHVSIISPGYGYRTIAPDVVAQIKTHPAVDHAISAKPLSMVANAPIVGESPIPIYAVREQDLPILLEAYGLHLGEGTVVQPRSDHVILTRALARNRGLGVGDAIGHPVHERDGMPTELTVVGLLESVRPTLVDRGSYDVPPMPRWAGFASYEYVNGHERYTDIPTHMLIVPAKGREADLEVWLEEAIASPQVKVTTLSTSYRLWRGAVQTVQTTSAISWTILTVVAVLGLAILNTIFVMQRRDEFGTLHAVGHSRTDLIRRTIREGASITVAAWLIGAAICIVVMLLAQATLYAPLGTSIDFFNPTPWLFTLPIPLAVIVASTGTIGGMLSRLDPVAVIERR